MARGARRSAWTAAACASVVLGLCAWARGTLDAPWIAASVAALALGGFVGGLFRTRIRAAPEASAHARHSVAEALLANIPDPVILVDRRAVVIEVNPAARALLPALKLRHPLSFALRAPDVLDGIEEVLRTGAPLKTLYATRVPTERAFEVQIGALPMPDGPAGGQPNVVLFLRDLTSARRLEAMRVDFVANASHELRTPLASILGYVETLSDEAGEDAEVRARFLTVMWNEARRMQRLVEDLISLSRIEAEKYRLPGDRLDFGELVEDVAAEIAAARSPRAEDVSVTIDPDLPEVVGDEAQLSQLLHNLIGNAMKYGRAGTPVDVRLEPGTSGGVRLTVTDQGEGIAPEHLPRLTERFYRVDTGRSRSLGGTGLGLAIVKHIVERHRGRLDIVSQVGVGTTVSVILPPASATPKGGVIKG